MKKRLLFGITSLTLGGAERVLVDLANNLSERYDITIFTIYSKGELEKQLSNKIKIKTLLDKSYSELSNFQKKFSVPLKILFFKNQIYRKYIEDNYDEEIAFLEGPITRLFSVKSKKTRKIAWIHNDITSVFGNGIKAKIKKFIDKKIYLNFRTLIFVSKDNLKKFEILYKNLDKIEKKVIYNYIDKESVIKKSEQTKEIEFDKKKVNFVTVARLVPQKAIDRLMRAYKELNSNKLYSDFYVIGDGPEKEKLEKMIKDYNIEDTFHLFGKKENPYPYIKDADYFCLLSNFEGYGMVLEEAKILNKKIIITDTAAREAVENYENSIILENSEQGIYEGLKKIIENEKQKNEKFEKDNIILKEYDNHEIIEQIIQLIEN